MENNVKRKKPGKGMVFSDLIYVKGVKERLDKNGRPYQTFYFIIGQDMGFMSCTWYGDQKLKDGDCLKLLKGRFCPRKTQQNVTFMNFRVEGFEIWTPPKTQPVDYGEFSVDVPVDGKVIPDGTKNTQNDDLNWIDESDSEESQKDDGSTLVDVNEVTF